MSTASKPAAPCAARSTVRAVMARGVVAAGIVLLPALGPARAAPETIALPGERLFPESITSTADGTLYVSTMTHLYAVAQAR